MMEISTTQEANLVFMHDTSDDMVKSTVSGTRFGSLPSISQTMIPSIKEILQFFFVSNRPSREVLCRSEIFSDRRLQ